MRKASQTSQWDSASGPIGTDPLTISSLKMEKSCTALFTWPNGHNLTSPIACPAWCQMHRMPCSIAKSSTLLRRVLLIEYMGVNLCMQVIKLSKRRCLCEIFSYPLPIRLVWGNPIRGDISKGPSTFASSIYQRSVKNPSQGKNGALAVHRQHRWVDDAINFRPDHNAAMRGQTVSTITGVILRVAAMFAIRLVPSMQDSLQ